MINKEIDFTIATICDTDISIKTLQSVINLMAKYKFVWDVGSLGSYNKSKNSKWTQFLKSNSPILINIDRDISFKTPDLELLLEDLDKYDFVGAAYATRDGRMVTAWDLDGKGIDFNGEIYEVKYLSHGFSAMKRVVLYRLVNELDIPLLNKGQPLEQYPFTMDTFLDDEVMGKIWLSEDYYFCNLCRKIGIKPMLDTRIKVGHLGDMLWYPEHASANIRRENEVKREGKIGNTKHTSKRG